jgi:cytoskeleton protein RodZ
MADRKSGGFGGKLRTARERRHMSLRDMANATKISVASLDALERNDIARLPGGIFSRAFVRAYAIEVGLEPDAALQEFIAQFPHDSVTAADPASYQAEDNVAIEGERRTASIFLKLIGVSLPIAVALLYFGSLGRRSEPAPASSSSDTKTPRRPPVEPAAATGKFVVHLSALRACAITLVVDGNRTIARQLQAGEQQEVDVIGDVLLTAADAAAIVMTINGALARPLGASGEAVSVHLTGANFREYVPVR